MSITDELRKWVKSLYTPNSAQVNADEAFRIADRIDKAHDDKLMQAKAVVLLDCISAADDFIELPKDADGQTIHLQDRMMWDNGTFNVHELNLTADGWTTWDELHGYTVRADQCRHVQPDSWERIIRDAQGDGILNQIDGRPSDFEALVERCKRLAGEDE